MAMKPIQDTVFGLYVWRMPDGSYVQDTDGNFLNIPSVEHDREKMRRLRQAVNYFGIHFGKPVFMPGRRRVTDDELEEQKQRQRWGLTPDIYDAGALLEELREKKANG